MNNSSFPYKATIRAQNIRNSVWPKCPVHLQLAKMSVAKTSWQKCPGKNVRGQMSYIRY